MSEASEPSSAYFGIETDNHASWLVVVSITFLIYSFFAITGKVISRVRRSTLDITALQSYDWVILGAFLVALAQCTLTIRACHSGLGQHEASLSVSSLNDVRKVRPPTTLAASAKEAQFLFAGSLLNVAVHALAKLSTALIIIAINERKSLEIASKATGAVSVVWAIGSILLLSFRCGSTVPWTVDRGRCINDSRVYIAINLFNALTDLVLVVIPCMMMWRVQTNKSVKMRVVGLFATRLLVPILVIIQAAYLQPNFDDETWQLVEPLTIGQIALHTSIVTACVPSLKGVIDTLWSGASVFTAPGHYTSTTEGLIYGVRSRVTKTQMSNQGPPPFKNKDRSKDRSKERTESQEELRQDTIVRTVEYEVEFK